VKKALEVYRNEWGLPVSGAFLLLFGCLMLRSIAVDVFPVYYGYVLVGVVMFVICSQIDFEIWRAFSGYLYGFSVLALLATLVMGTVTRGVVRWIPIGPWTVQPAEIVRPFLLLFFASYLTREKIQMRKFVTGILMFFVPLSLILLQPSLGVSVLTAMGFGGIVLSLDFNKRMLGVGVVLMMMFAPLTWFFLAPYQKARLMALANPAEDPFGAGYNSIQSKIAVGSGGIWGRGLGEGVQTQLYFLPERQTDFIFASVAEETGFIGALILTLGVFFVLYRLVAVMGNAASIAGRTFVAGVFLTFFGQVLVHIGMNMGLFPITGIPLPLVSMGGSSLVGTMMMLGVVMSVKKR